MYIPYGSRSVSTYISLICWLFDMLQTKSKVDLSGCPLPVTITHSLRSSLSMLLIMSEKTAFFSTIKRLRGVSKFGIEILSKGSNLFKIGIKFLPLIKTSSLLFTRIFKLLQQKYSPFCAALILKILLSTCRAPKIFSRMKLKFCCFLSYMSTFL